MRCKRFDKLDDTLQLDEVDYECEVGKSDSPFTVWVGSNSKRITGLDTGGP